MKARLITLIMLAAMLALPTALYAQESDPAAVVTAVYEAWNAGDVEAYLALVADGAVIDIPGWGTHTGLEDIRAWAEGLIALHSEMEFEILQVEGDTVTLRSWYTDDDFRALGIVLEATETVVVQDGKIASDTWIVTDESWAELQAAMAALPETGGAPLPSDGLLTVLGGLVLCGGLVLGRLFRRRRHQHP